MPGPSFPATRGSLLAAMSAGDAGARQRAWDELLRGYWRPIHRYLCLRWRARPEEAEDWTQEFLTRALERGTFDGFDPARARFRTFLRVCLDRWVVNQLQAAGRLKRGGDSDPLSLDGLVADGIEPAGGNEGDPEEVFHREWLRAVFATALDDLRELCADPARAVRWRLFARYDLGEAVAGGRETASAASSMAAASGDLTNDGLVRRDDAARPSYAELAAEEGLPVTQVTNHLAWARRELRRLVVAELQRQTTSERELRDEARRALGVELP